MHNASHSPPQHIGWWHQIELPNGAVTPGADASAAKLASLHLPSLAGKTVLDVGAWDGYFSFAAERAGASRVLAADSWAWQRPGGKDGFEYARSALDSKVEDLEIEVLDISPETVGHFDVVLFLGVLYHMRHPLLALERVASVTNELLVVETHVDMRYIRSPAAAFYPGSALGDDSNWWGPNRPALLGMLRSVGFKQTSAYPVKRLTRARARGRPTHTPQSASVMADTPRGSRARRVRELLLTGRLVAHGWR